MRRISLNFIKCLTKKNNMNHIFITVLSLSVSGSLMALILFAGKPLLKNRVSGAFSYYIWLVVLLRLALPITSPVNAVDALVHIWQPDGETAGQADVPAAARQTGNSLRMRTAFPEAQKSKPENSKTPAGAGQSVSGWRRIQNCLRWVWLSGSLLSFGWFTAAYAYDSRRIRRSCAPPHPDDLALFRQMTGNSRVGLACSGSVATPVLIGIFRPVIILPQFAYVRNAMGGELKNALRHELTHDRRKDILYKWLVVAVTSLHWFNPLMLLIRREIGRACELSCDEAVISGLSAGERRRYGNTLLTFSAVRKFPAGISATNLSAGKAELKERLIRIMRYQKRSAWALLWTLLLTVLLTGCAIGLGASTGAGGLSASAGGAQTSAGGQTENSAAANGGGSSARQSVLTQIDAALDTKVPLLLPASVPTAENRYLTAATVSEPADYKVNFYETDQAAKINSQAASRGTLIASLEGTEYQNAESAEESILAAGYEKADLSSADSDAVVDLGHQIKAVGDAGLGHQILTWNEGRWCLRVDSPTDSAFQGEGYPDSRQLAREVAAYLEGHMLPTPREKGVVTIYLWKQNGGTAVEWQARQTVYQIRSQDPMTALKIAVKMKAAD